MNNSTRTSEEMSGASLPNKNIEYHYVGDYGSHRFYTEVLNNIPEAIEVENKDAEKVFANLINSSK